MNTELNNIAFCEWAIFNRYYRLENCKLIWYKPRERINGLTTQELYQEFLKTLNNESI